MICASRCARSKYGAVVVKVEGVERPRLAVLPGAMTKLTVRR